MDPQTVDYLVIGAGPAGLGYFLDRGGRDYGRRLDTRDVGHQAPDGFLHLTGRAVT